MLGECTTRCHVKMFTTMIFRHVRCGQGQKAQKLFQQIQQEGVQPNAVTFVGVLKACASMVAMEEGRCVHEEIVQSVWDLLLQRGWFIYFLWGCFIVIEVPRYPENLSNIFGVLHFHVFPRFSGEHENCPNTFGVSGTSSWICKFLNMQSCLS